MRKIMSRWLCLILLITATEAVAADEARYTQQLNQNHDRVIRRAVVPSTDRPQGEVQLVQRHNLLVVQTLLNSRVLKRVVAIIDSREQRSWPESRSGYLDSTRYRDELFRATGQAWKTFRQREDQNEQQQKLLIEFILGPKQSLVALSLPQYDGSFGRLTVRQKQPVRAWAVSKGYIRENMLEIIRENFNLDDTAAEKLLVELQSESDSMSGN